ncbi:MAG TPA: RNA-directed DNA polymerase [Verrucomicrobiae bacterium]|nr:RNA-directed DNA polymerase [Verrucomicrobiae bacterium]
MPRVAVDSWEELSLTDVFFAFRKAKADCFFERSICIASKFAEYEQDLADRLAELLAALRSGGIADVLSANLGEPRVVAKKLNLSPKKSKKKSTPDGHGFFSDPKRAFERLCARQDLIPEFRLVGDFPVDMHVASALWINLIGHKFDAVLSNSSYGSRLRRYRPEPGSPKGSLGKYHLEAIGSFQPYFTPYKGWRNRGFQAIRRELEAEQAVIAVSMDITSFYHRIDPSFIADTNFLSNAGIELTEWELSFTKAFSSAIEQWSEMVTTEMQALGCHSTDAGVGGLPIGLSLSRVAANALLVSLDRDIEQGLTPVYYGRYVDDLFLVLRDPGNLSTAKELLGFIAARTKSFPDPGTVKNGEIYLRLPEALQGRTTLLLQETKQKVFFLQGPGGLDLLHNIESQIRSVSSERRLMTSPDQLESMASAKVLTAAGHPTEEADTLRRADGLSVRRLGWSIQLRVVETLARDLPVGDWHAEREQFYRFAHSHILRPDRILDHLDYFPRLLSLAVALMDWPAARRLIDATMNAIFELHRQTSSQSVKVNGCKAEGHTESLWQKLTETTLDLARDAVLRSLRWDHRSGQIRPLSDTAGAVFDLIGLENDPAAVGARALLLRETDWAKIAYKDHLRRHASRQRPAISGEPRLRGLYRHEEDLREFLDRSIAVGKGLSSARVHPRCFSGTQDPDRVASLLPYLLPTRPYTSQEISLFLPDECVFGWSDAAPARNWARYVRAIRGVWVWGELVAVGSVDSIDEKIQSGSGKDSLPIALIGQNKTISSIRLGISSLLTTDRSFASAASGQPDLSRERYQRIERIVNQAIDAYPRPTHLLLPELSLPERWVDTVSGKLRQAGISLVAGLDYHREKPNLIHSEAVLVLADDRLGFPSSVQIRQAKSLPAVGEEEILLKNYGQEWPTRLASVQKPVYIHAGFCFGVLVCSELQNVSHRQRFQGDVDCLVVLSWNQDLDTFSALVEAASLDVHAHIALVNNRRYGDSRVRTPAKEPYKRDTCRLRGGENEHLVVVNLDIADLRAFQSRAKRWSSKDDPFKPVPEGYEIASFRRTPPK